MDLAKSTQPTDPNPNPTRIFGYESIKFEFGQMIDPDYPNEILVEYVSAKFWSGSDRKRVDQCFHCAFSL